MGEAVRVGDVNDREQLWPRADACIKCGLCVAACPVYRVAPAFAGPKGLGPEWYRRTLDGAAETDPSVEDCTFCQLCEAACPVGVPVAHLIARHKAHRPRPLRRQIRDFVLVRPHWVARLPFLAAAPPALARALDLSVRAARPRRQTAPRREPSVEPTPARGTVALYVDCYARGFDTGTVAAARDLLRGWGYAVRLVPRTAACCGAAAYAGGQPDVARRVAGDAARLLAADLDDAAALVTLNATCDATLRNEWPRYLGLSLAVPVVSWSDFAVANAPDAFWEQVKQSDLEVGATWLHSTCRGKVAGGGASLIRLAAQAGAGDARVLDLDCCGAAGSYAFKVEHEPVAFALGAQAKDQVAKTPDGVLVVDSGTCALHLAQMTGRPALHPAAWLWQRYRRARERTST
jgi:glycerol-3-phosphate dehydrogenase subunit C